ncbi:MAG: RNA 2',3'-cyclic phosphodiesterase [Burkholderiales bacterium]|nr:RNA 2',3'-cyclic phosphodiesterase [Burkholderiales bacterium]
MTRLFVALDLPPAVAAGLALLQPSSCAGLRLTRTADLHLTLHFIGEAGVAPMAQALQAVRAPPFSLRLAGLGSFRARDGSHMLWAGVEPNAALLALHEAVGLALAGTGFQPDARRYHPHITLARCKPDLPATVVSAFLAQSAGLDWPELAVTGFALYSSITDSAGAQYRREQWFPLAGAAGKI